MPGSQQDVERVMRFRNFVCLVPRELIFLLGVRDSGEVNLFQVVGTLGFPGLFPAPQEGGYYEPGDNSYDRNNDQQLDQRKPVSLMETILHKFCSFPYSSPYPGSKAYDGN